MSCVSTSDCGFDGSVRNAGAALPRNGERTYGGDARGCVRPAMEAKSMTTPQFPQMAALAAAVLILGACHYGPATSDGPVAAGIGAVLERSDTLLFTGQHSRWSLTAGEETIADTMIDRATCTAARCVTADGTTTTVQDLAEAFGGMDSGVSEATLGMRGGFETATTQGSFEVTESLPDITVTAAPEAMSYGFWGEHGLAAVTIAEGTLSGHIEGAPFSGDFALATAWATGGVTGTNPAGLGSATWRGIAEAVETGTFKRLQGTATVSIADLSRPRAGVAIDVPGHAIGAPGWADMSLSAGGFTAGTPGGGDWLTGNFHGPEHDEAWGIFDTTDYIGAFGAKREP